MTAIRIISKLAVYVLITAKNTKKNDEKYDIPTSFE